MKRGYGFWLLIGSLLAIQLLLVGMKYPAPLYSPGDVVEAHSKIRCKGCHAPFKRVPSESCSTVKCHPEGKIGKKPAITDLHNRMKGKDCLTCHTEHLGLKGKITKAFDHEPFAKISKCLECHSTDGDKAHKDKYSGDCSSCHNTKNWKAVTFDHSKTSPKPCVECHKGPKDDMHGMGAIGSCGDCHGTKAWKPSTYNHEKYFFLDKDHKVLCNKCHDTGSYKKYTCLGCHEHSGGKIDREHREEGISNFGDCLRCHRVNIDGRSYGNDKVHESSKPCTECHKGPKDDMHKMGAIGSCGDCHGTKAWKPSTYNHEKYLFLDKDHKVSCNKCHDMTSYNSYKKYTCMNCHEHSGGKIDREHSEEGIKNYGDCLRCHQVNMGGRSYGTDKTHEGIGN